MRTISLVALALAAGSAAAQSTAPGPAGDESASRAFRGQLEVADRNGDSLLSREEAEASLPSLVPLFGRMDADHDGQLSESELQSFQADGRERIREDLEQRFVEADVDKDGSLDLAEAQTGLPIVAANFFSLDRDNDGKVTPEELRNRGRVPR
jgi:hypothetical protein